MEKETLAGVWRNCELIVFKNGVQEGVWPEIGTWIFYPTAKNKGYFCYTTQYLGDDKSYPSHLLPFLASSGTYVLEGDQLVTDTIGSSAINRLGKSQRYKCTIEGNILIISASFGIDGEFSSVLERADN